MNTLGKGIMIASAVASLIASGSLVARARGRNGALRWHYDGVSTPHEHVAALREPVSTANSANRV